MNAVQEIALYRSKFRQRSLEIILEHSHHIGTS